MQVGGGRHVSHALPALAGTALKSGARWHFSFCLSPHRVYLCSVKWRKYTFVAVPPLGWLHTEDPRLPLLMCEWHLALSFCTGAAFRGVTGRPEMYSDVVIGKITSSWIGGFLWLWRLALQFYFIEQEKAVCESPLLPYFISRRHFFRFLFYVISSVKGYVDFVLLPMVSEWYRRMIENIWMFCSCYIYWKVTQLSYLGVCIFKQKVFKTTNTNLCVYIFSLLSNSTIYAASM